MLTELWAKNIAFLKRYSIIDGTFIGNILIYQMYSKCTFIFVGNVFKPFCEFI